MTPVSFLVTGSSVPQAPQNPARLSTADLRTGHVGPLFTIARTRHDQICDGRCDRPSYPAAAAIDWG